MTGENGRLFVLNEPSVLRISPTLATEIGLNESIMLLQIEFWISISDNVQEGKRWTYQSVREMKEKAFPFWSLDTINRTVHSLLRKGLLIEGNYNKQKYDKTRWFALGPGIAELNSVRLDSGCRTGVYENHTRSTQNHTRSTQNRTTIPEITTETTTESIMPPADLPSVTTEEKEILRVIRDIPNYPFDYQKDIEHIRKLSLDYPDVDLLDEIKKWETWLLDKPLKKRSNPRLQIRNWMANATRFKEQKEQSHGISDEVFDAAWEEAQKNIRTRKKRGLGRDWD